MSEQALTIWLLRVQSHSGARHLKQKVLKPIILAVYTASHCRVSHMVTGKLKFVKYEEWAPSSPSAERVLGFLGPCTVSTPAQALALLANLAARLVLSGREQVIQRISMGFLIASTA